MRKKFVAFVLCLSILLSGCGAVELLEYVRSQSRGLVKFSEIQYERPSESELQEALEEGCRIAAESNDVDDILEQVWAFYDIYEQICTMYFLTEIHYCGDLTDVYWQAEHEYCLELTNRVEQALDQLYRSLAAAPCRLELEEAYFGEGFFDAYQGESLWDSTFQELMSRESGLQSRYYELANQTMQAGTWGSYDASYTIAMEELFVEMIALRQETAAYAGYDSYQEFAYDWYYARDYSPAQSEALMEQICQKLAPLFREMDHTWAEEQDWFSEAKTLGYVRNTANAMGGTVQEAFSVMEDYGLYDIAYSENKYDSSFELYLPSFQEPFVFLNPVGSVYDGLSLAHEFGHFCSDYACYGSMVPTDVAEVFSQGMEYLSLCYGNTPEILYRMKMEDCLSCYVVQSAYAAFEHQVYDLTGEELTTDHVAALFADICRQYGLEEVEPGSWGYVNVIHFFTNPMYIISYVVSNDVAFQLYQLERQQAGEGLKVYTDHLTTTAASISEFVEEAGLVSPFQPGRLDVVAKSISEMMG